MKFFFCFFIYVHLVSCVQEGKPDTRVASERTALNDTVIIKRQKALSGPNEVGIYSRLYYYNFVAGKDTLPFGVIVSEWERDSTVSLSVHHNKEAILFSTALDRIEDCLVRIKEDFDLSKLKYFSFECPAVYPDLAKDVSLEYKKKFGWKDVSYEKLNQFFLQTDLNKKVNEILKSIGKKATHYGIEKFHLSNKEGVRLDHPELDVSEYPEFFLHGMGLSVRVNL